MFTGIIEAVGQIKQVEQRDQGVRLTIKSDRLDFSDVAVGDSIAANGVCLTVISLAGSAYTVDVSQESLNCTVGLGEPGEVNLEKAMRLSDRLGGHLVSGHVDGVGEVVKFEPVGESHLLRIRAPRELARFIATKGSITINGVSLTVNEVSDVEFTINLIPHTVEVTTLKYLKPGTRVNLEVDMLARYVDRLLHPEPY
ncbi:MAG: riboflavin synthase [Gammaproteobacteria bacterium]|nr:riboflavin synthase [Gammaproteobacteria bacterium]MBU1978537.1 riboflavin synthase [Gammaproteobacteria bacterium]